MKYPNLITPAVGQVYHNRGGADYRCTEVLDSGRAVMVRLHDNWTLVAHGVRQYDNGDIEWDWSTGGHWPTLHTSCPMRRFIRRKEI